MEILCTRPGCSHPKNSFSDIDDPKILKTIQQKYCTTCGMPLILGGRYLPVRLLGQGGFGAAFLARDRYTPTMRFCVVKQFQPSGHLTQAALDIAQGLFEREAVVLEQLGQKHQQIPDLFAFFPLIVPSSSGGQETQFFYLVQEFIDGQDLEAELTTKGQFSEAEVTEVMEEILKVLQYVHENGSIHRDIKPSNIMRDKGGILYLLDFGAVKQVAVGAGNAPKGSTGIFTQGFAPPEQMQGQKVYPATDLYALAVTCLNLLTGKPPDQLFDSYHNTWNWKAYAPQVSDRLAAIFDRLLLPTPSERFTSAAEVLQAFNPPPTPNTAIQPPPLTPSPRPPLAPRPRFSSVELLKNAGFTGFEAVLLIIALKSLIPSPGIIVAVACITIGGLIFVQYRRILEGKDLPIIAGLSLFLMFLVPIIRGGLAFPIVAMMAILAGSGAIAVTALFRLIYQLLSRLL